MSDSRLPSGNLIEVLDDDLIDETELAGDGGGGFEDESTQIYQPDRHDEPAGFEDEATRVFQAGEDPSPADEEFEDEATRVWQAEAPAPAPAPVRAASIPVARAAARPAAVGAARIPAGGATTQGVTDLRASAASVARRGTEATVITDPLPQPAARQVARATASAAAPAAKSSAMVPVLAVLLVGAALAIVALLFRAGTPAPTAEVGRVAVFTMPPGARVSVDGQIQPNPTPTTLSDLTVGTAHTITVTLEGYEEQTDTILVASAEPTQRTYQLAPATATLNVRSVPEGAAITVDGVARGAAPVSIPGLDSSKTYTVAANLPGYDAATQTVSWAAGAPREQLVALTLTATPPPAPTPEEPAIAAPAAPRAATTAPAAARVRRPRTRASTARPRTPQRPARARACAPPRARPAAASTGGARERPSARTVPAPAPAPAAAGVGTLSIQAVPYGQVWIDGRMVAPETPLINHSLPSGVHTVKVYYVSLREFSEERSVRVEPDQNRTITFRAQR
ncbi:MAG: PEGA domain-containing protein [Myxococcales bacterium]|nr:PEGA domain-containing protein [Myxococcales bacterium]